MHNIDLLSEILETNQNIFLTGHRNPDGDALGSTLGLALFLKGMGHTVTVAYPSDYPEIFDWMPEIDKTIIFDRSSTQAKEIIQEADLFFILDFNDLDRIDKMGELIAKTGKDMVMIDHHLYPKNFAKFTFSDSSASSTSEMVFRFIDMLGKKDRITKSIGDCLYTGIITDTGSFRFGTSARLFRIVAQLLDTGVDDYTIQNSVHNSLSEKNITLLGLCLNKRMRLFPEYKAGIIYLTREDYEKYNIQRGETEGIVNYLLMMKNIEVGVFIMQQPKITKLSFRSKGDIDVQEIAAKYFKGGGHKNAAGGASYKGLKATINNVIAVFPELMNQPVVSDK